MLLMHLLALAIYRRRWLVLLMHLLGHIDLLVLAITMAHATGVAPNTSYGEGVQKQVWHRGRVLDKIIIRSQVDVEVVTRCRECRNLNRRKVRICRNIDRSSEVIHSGNVRSISDSKQHEAAHSGVLIFDWCRDQLHKGSAPSWRSVLG